MAEGTGAEVSGAGGVGGGDGRTRLLEHPLPRRSCLRRRTPPPPTPKTAGLVPPPHPQPPHFPPPPGDLFETVKPEPRGTFETPKMRQARVKEATQKVSADATHRLNGQALESTRAQRARLVILSSLCVDRSHRHPCPRHPFPHLPPTHLTRRTKRRWSFCWRTGTPTIIRNHL